MPSSFVTLNFDTEFPIPRDCLPRGDVTCRVIRADCDIVNNWNDWVTFRIRLVLRITIRSGERVCSFTREVVRRATVWLDAGFHIAACEVTAAVCRCVAHRGRLLCSIAVKVAFFLKQDGQDPCRLVCHCHRQRCHRCRDDYDDWDELTDDVDCHEDIDCHEDTDCHRDRQIKVQVIPCDPKPCQRSVNA